MAHPDLRRSFERLDALDDAAPEPARTRSVRGYGGRAAGRLGRYVRGEHAVIHRIARGPAVMGTVGAAVLLGITGHLAMLPAAGHAMDASTRLATPPAVHAPATPAKAVHASKPVHPAPNPHHP